MTNYFDIETSKIINSSLDLYSETINAPLSVGFDLNALKTVKDAITTALPVINRWMNIDEDDPEWDEDLFNKEISTDGNTAAWDFIMSLHNATVRGDSISLISLSGYLEQSVNHAHGLYSWLHPDVRDGDYFLF